MPVGSTSKTLWEEQADPVYVLDPDTGLPTGSVTTPAEAAGPGMEFLGDTSFSLDGSLPKWLAPSDGASVVKLSARGGEVYYEINAVGGADATSPGYVPDGQTETIGPLCNMSSLWVFSATADTVVHASFWRELNTALAGSWPTPAYWERVMATNPIAYWPLWEKSGTVAHCLVNPAQNGTYNSDVSGWPTGIGIGDGNSAPGFDGTNDYVNVNTVALKAAFNTAEGSLHLWLKVAAAGVWTDGTARYAMRFSVDGNNYIIVIKASANNTLTWTYAAGGVTEARSTVTAGPTDWFTMGMSWSKSAEEVRYYLSGAWQETDTTLGVWAGAFANMFIGVANAVPTFQWSGSLAHGAIWDRVLPGSAFADLATV
jgi:hypothetical protein